MSINKSFIKILFLLAPVLVNYSCSKRSEIGLGLSQDGNTNLQVMDTLPFTVSFEKGDSLLTSNNSLVRRFCGHHTHSIYGTTDAALFMNFKLSKGRPSFVGATIDSVVLKLYYDEGGQENIGNINTAQTWEVLRVGEDINDGENYYSNREFTTNDVLNSGFTFVPNPKDKIITPDTNGLDTARAHIRIPLTGNFINELLNPVDTAKFQTSDAFQDYFKGVCVRSKSSSSNTALVAMDFLYNPPVVSVYYTKNGTKYRYDFNKGSGTASIANYKHDYTGTPIESASATDTLSYCQGTGGVRFKLKFPTAQDLNEIIVNKAILRLSVVSPSYTDDQYPLPDQLIVSYRNNEGKLVVIEDVASISTLGGKPQTVQGNGRNTELQYEINLSGHFQRIVDKTIDSNEIIISIYSPSENGEILTVGNERAIKHAPKFTLTYTEFPQ